MTTPPLKSLIEAALFTAERPLTIDHFLELFIEAEQPERKAVRAILQELTEDYAERGVELVQVASGYRFQTNPNLTPWLKRLLQPERSPRYSRALLETMAIIAYRQPITRSEIEKIRGISVSTDIIKRLLDYNWIRVLAHRDSPGHPALYGTTRAFLDYFNLKNLSDLPTITELREMELPTDIFESEDTNEQNADAENDDAEKPDDFQEKNDAEKLDDFQENQIDETTKTLVLEEDTITSPPDIATPQKQTQINDTVTTTITESEDTPINQNTEEKLADLEEQDTNQSVEHLETDNQALKLVTEELESEQPPVSATSSELPAPEKNFTSTPETTLEPENQETKNNLETNTEADQVLNTETTTTENEEEILAVKEKQMNLFNGSGSGYNE